jgi:hypothetical protein
MITVTKPNWGEWTSHVDTTNSSQFVSEGLKTAEMGAVVLFNSMAVELRGNSCEALAGSAVLAGHCPIKLPPEFPLNGFLLIARGDVVKMPDTDAVLTMTLGEGSYVHTWHRDSRIIDRDTGETVNQVTEDSFDLTCFSFQSHLGVGNPPIWPALPPLSVSLGISARRRTVDEEILVQVSNIELVILAMPDSRRK